MAAQREPCKREEVNMTDTRTIIVKNKAGLHARTAASLVMLANSFTSLITIERGNVRVNGKSIIGIISLGAAYDTALTVTATGVDSHNAIDAISLLFENNLGES
jgi:phosphocarrier protein HPr